MDERLRANLLPSLYCLLTTSANPHGATASNGVEIEPNFSGDKLTCRLTRYDGRRIYLDLSAPKDRERAESALRDFVSRAEQQLKLSMEEFTIRDSDIDQTQADLLMEIGRTPAPE